MRATSGRKRALAISRAHAHLVAAAARRFPARQRRAHITICLAACDEHKNSERAKKWTIVFERAAMLVEVALNAKRGGHSADGRHRKKKSRN